MATITAHITYRGNPVCGCPQLLHQLGYSPICGHNSIASAKRAVKKLQKTDWGYKVVRGSCPA